MIFYLVTQQGHGTTEYVNSWGPAPNSRMRYLLYSDLRKVRQLEKGTYLFTDHERLAPAELQLARQLWDTLAASRPAVRCVNDPSAILSRFDLLQRLYDEGTNRFRAVRASELTGCLDALSYPVFVREEKEHTGNLTPLLQTPTALLRALRHLGRRGFYKKDLLVVEFCDTADDAGVYRKYSAFRLAGRIHPRHVLFSRHWNLKTTDLEDPGLQAERDEYLNTNPHEAQISRIFDLARYDFGRIDYSLLDGKLQVWEINSNPTVRRLTPRLTAGFEELDRDGLASPIPWAITKDLDRALQAIQRRLLLTRKHRELARRILR